MTEELGDGVSLSPQDAAALDALLEASFIIEDVPQNLRARATHVGSLMGLLDVPGGVSDRTLVDVTLARLVRDGAPGEVVLMPDDEEAIDALMSTGFEADRVPRALRERAERVVGLMGLVGSGGVEDGRAQLIERTLAGVQSSINETSDRMQFDPAGARRGRSLRLSDLTAVAALLIVGVSVVWPMLTAVGAHNSRSACTSSMAVAGIGVSSYSDDNRGSWPIASASQAGNPWWNVGSPEQSNSAHSYLLARTGYATLANLACPGNPDAVDGPVPDGRMDWQSIREVSYSGQNMFALVRPALTSGDVVIMADRSPVIPLAVQGRAIFPFHNSPNHGGRGQNILRSGGQVEWVTSPVLESGDNLWLPAPIERLISRLKMSESCSPLKGTETPQHEDDAFLVP